MIENGIPRRTRHLWFWVLLLVVHGTLFVYDVRHPEAILQGDRAAQRHQRILEFVELSPSEWPSYFLQHGLPGDYLPHAVLYGLFGRLGLILIQVGLAFLSVVLVHRIAARWTGRRTVADVAAAALAFLPHSLAFPHLLMSEALFNPLLILGVYLVVRGTDRQRVAGGSTWAGALIFGLASLIRVIGAMVPFLLAPAVALGVTRWRRRIGVGAGFVLIGLAPVLLWMSFVRAGTGEFSLGQSSFSLPYNLEVRVERMDVRTPESLAVDDTGTHGVTVGEYLEIVASNPGAYWKIVRSDLINFWANPGVSKLFFNYLSLGGDLRGADRSLLGWRSVMDESGLRAAVWHVWTTAPLVATVLLVSVGAWGAFLVFALPGAIHFSRSEDVSVAWRISTLLVVLAFWLVNANISGIARSGHRSPVEFLLATAFAIGVVGFYERFRRS